MAGRTQMHDSVSQRLNEAQEVARDLKTQIVAPPSQAHNDRPTSESMHGGNYNACTSSEVPSSAPAALSEVAGNAMHAVKDSAHAITDRLAGVPSEVDPGAMRVGDMLGESDTPYPGDDTAGSASEKANTSGTMPDPAAAGMKAFSPVERCPPSELPDNPEVVLPEGIAAQAGLPTSPRRVPSGLLICSHSAPGTDQGNSAAITSLPPGVAPTDLQILEHSDNAPPVDDALLAALAGSAGMEVTGAPTTAAGTIHSFTSPMTSPMSSPISSPTRTSTTAGPGHSHGGISSAAGEGDNKRGQPSILGQGGLMSKVLAPFIAYAGPDDRALDDPSSDPSYVDKGARNPMDSNQTMNLGSGGDQAQDNAAYTGSVPMAVATLSDKLRATVNETVEAAATLLGDAKHDPGISPEDLPGMPGDTPADHEYREMRRDEAIAQAEDRSALLHGMRDASSTAADAARAGDQDTLREMAERHADLDQRTAAPAMGGGGPGVTGNVSAAKDHPTLHPVDVGGGGLSSKAVADRDAEGGLPIESQDEGHVEKQHVAGRGGGGLGALVGKIAEVLHIRSPAPPETPPETKTSKSAHDTPSSVSLTSPPQEGHGPSMTERQDIAGSGHMQPAEYAAAIGRETAAERRAHKGVPDQAMTQQKADDVPRAKTHAGTSTVELPPTGEGKAAARKALGIPVGALHATEARGDLNTKEGGGMVPAGAMGQTQAQPGEHVQAFAPDFGKPNFFEEVGKRGLGNVLEHGVANVKDGAAQAYEEVKRGGEAAPWATTAGGISDTKDVARNVERMDHLDDPLQRKIYDAETYKVKVPAVHAKVVHDMNSEEEKMKEATSALVLGKNKAISGAVPHDKPDLPIGSSAQPTGPGPKTQAGKSMFDSIGTASGCGPEGFTNRSSRGSIRDVLVPYMRDIPEDTVMVVNPEEGPEPGSGSSSGRFMDVVNAAMDAFIPSAKAFGGGAAGTPTGTDHTQRPPTANWGDNTSGRNPMAEGAGRPEEHDVPSVAGYDNAPHAEVKRAHTEAEGPPSTDDTAERLVMEQMKSRVMGGPEAAGVPRRGADQPGGYTTIYGDLPERVAKHVDVEGLPDTLARLGESVGGALQHVVEKTEETVRKLPERAGLTGVHQETLSKQLAREAGGGDEDRGFYNPYLHPGGVGPAGPEYGGGAAMISDQKSGAEMSQLRKEKLEGMMEEPNPALKRDTLLDKVLYPFSKDASSPETAKKSAQSYFEYVEEKKQQAEQQDPDRAVLARDKPAEAQHSPGAVTGALAGLGHPAGVQRTIKMPDEHRQLAEKSNYGPTQLDEEGKPVTKGDADRLHEREHTWASDNIRTGYDVASEMVANVGEAVINTSHKIKDKLAMKGDEGTEFDRSGGVAQGDNAPAASPVEKLKEAADAASERADIESRKASDAARDAASSAREAVREAGASVSDRVQHGVDSARQSAAEARDRVTEGAEKLAGNVRSAVDTTSERVSERVDTAEEAGQKLRESVQRGAQDVRAGAREAADTLKKEGVDRDGTAALPRAEDSGRPAAHAEHAEHKHVGGLIDSAALLTGNVVESALHVLGSLLPGAHRREEEEAAAAGKASATGSTAESARHAALATAASDSGPGGIEALEEADERLHAPIDTPSYAPPAAPAAAGGTAPAHRDQGHHKEDSLLSKVMGGISDLLGGAGDRAEHAAGRAADKGSRALDDARDQMIGAMEPAGEGGGIHGPQGTGGYGRDVDEGFTHKPSNRQHSHDIPEMPFISTQELLAAQKNKE